MRRSWPIDFWGRKYVAVRSKDLRPNETPLKSGVAWKILERLIHRPESLAQLTELGHAVTADSRSSSSRFNLRALEKAFDSGEFVLLVRSNQVTRLIAEARDENIADQIREAQVVKTWIEFEVVDAEGKPYPNARFICMMPDGTIQEGSLDSRGKVRFDGIDPGNCVFELVDLDRDAWEKVS